VSLKILTSLKIQNYQRIMRKFKLYYMRFNVHFTITMRKKLFFFYIYILLYIITMRGLDGFKKSIPQVSGRNRRTIFKHKKTYDIHGKFSMISFNRE